MKLGRKLRQKSLEAEKAAMEKRIKEELDAVTTTEEAIALQRSPTHTDADKVLMAKQFATSAAGTANPLDYKVIKTNKFGKSQERCIAMDFENGRIVNTDGHGTVKKDHHASNILFVEACGTHELVVHLPRKKEYKLTFGSTKERGEFQEKMVKLCQETTRMNMPVDSQDYVIDEEASDASDENVSYTFTAFKYLVGKEIALKDTIVHVDKTGVNFCSLMKAADADTPDDMAEDQVALQIEQSYSFKRIRSWNNEELFVELEIVTKGPTSEKDEKYEGFSAFRLKGDTVEDCCELVEAIQLCLHIYAKRVKRVRKERKAAAARKKAEKEAAGVEDLSSCFFPSVMHVVTEDDDEEDDGDEPEQVLVHVDESGIAICDPLPDGMSLPAADAKDKVKNSLLAKVVRTRFPFTVVQSVDGEGARNVRMQLLCDGSLETHTFTCPDIAGQGRLLKALAENEDDSKQAAEVKAGDRRRRASLVVDMAVLAANIEVSGEGMTQRRDSLLDTVLAGGEDSQQAMMAAACAAAGVEFGADTGFKDDDAENSVELDIIGVMSSSPTKAPAEGDTRTAEQVAAMANRRASLAVDCGVRGAAVESEIDAKERVQRAGLLKDLAEFVDGVGTAAPTMAPIGEDESEEEEEEDDDDDDDSDDEDGEELEV